ncbi:MAG: inositol monophosphatase, partial [Nanoarchaeota archaeon]
MIEIAKTAALEGGKILVSYFGKNLKILTKADKSFVSEADITTEKAVRKIINDAFPDHSIVAEEEGGEHTDEYCWYIDPLDGTDNFLNGIPEFCTSIGLAKKDVFLIGVIYNPITKELFMAEKGKGCTLNGKKIKVNTMTTTMGASGLDSTFRGEDRVRKKLLFMDRWRNHSTAFRLNGSNALQLARFAQGQFVVSVHDHFKAWDIAAGIVIAQEAGGIIMDQFGNEPTPQTTFLFAA